MIEAAVREDSGLIFVKVVGMHQPQIVHVKSGRAADSLDTIIGGRPRQNHVAYEKTFIAPYISIT